MICTALPHSRPAAQATPEAHKDLCYGRFECPGKTFAPDAGGWGSNFLNETALRRVGKVSAFVTTSPVKSETNPMVLKSAQASDYLQDHLGRRGESCADCQLPKNLQQASLQRHGPGPCRGQVYNLCAVSCAARVRALQDQYGQSYNIAMFCRSLTASQSHAVLDSNFSESKSTTRLPASSPPARDDRFLGDVSEFAAFGVRKASSQDQKPEQDVAASQDYNVADESAAHRSSVSPSDASGGQELVPLREFRLVKVPDCRFVHRSRFPSPVLARSLLRHHSYATLSTYLAYLYTPKLDFLPSPAFFLAEEKEPGSATESDFSRWSARKAKTGTYPSLPHALYRLADCYMESAIKARAKGWILQNITVETVRCLATSL